MTTRETDFLNDVIDGVSEADRPNVRQFAVYLMDWTEVNGIERGYDIFSLLEESKLHSWVVQNRDGPVLMTVWVVFLRVMSQRMDEDSMRRLFKYQTRSEFLRAYGGTFDDHPLHIQITLFHIANWMSILFTMMSPRKNKGLAINVVCKMVEGFGAKYVTGTGQTKATAARVRIFELEGDVKPHQRGLWKSVGVILKKRKSNAVENDENKVLEDDPLTRKPPQPSSALANHTICSVARGQSAKKVCFTELKEGRMSETEGLDAFLQILNNPTPRKPFTPLSFSSGLKAEWPNSRDCSIDNSILNLSLFNDSEKSSPGSNW